MKVVIFYHGDDPYHSTTVEKFSHYLKEDWSLNVTCQKVKYQEFKDQANTCTKSDITLFVNSSKMYASYLSYVGEARHVEGENSTESMDSDYLVNKIISISFDYTVTEHLLFKDHRFKLMEQITPLVTVLLGNDFSKFKNNLPLPWHQSSAGFQLKHAVDDATEHYNRQAEYQYSGFHSQSAQNSPKISNGHAESHVPLTMANDTVVTMNNRPTFIAPDFMSIDSEDSEWVLDAKLTALNGKHANQC